MDVIAQNIRDLCNHDRDVLEQLKTSFGLTEMGKTRTKRQFIVAATVAITSLITYFSTKELISMSSDEDDDELYDATNHIITAIQNHETRLVRLEGQQKTLDKHIQKLTGALLSGFQNHEVFIEMFAASTYATRLSEHINRIHQGLFVLLNNNKLHPDLVSWSQLERGLETLKKAALKASKKLILEHASDIFQLKADFVAFRNGIISILVHIPVEEKTFKLYKYIATPTFNEDFQFLVDTKFSYLAVNEDNTLYAVLKSLDECEIMRETIICTHINILHKVGGVGKQECLFDLFSNDLEKAAKSCVYRIGRPQNFAVRLSDQDIFTYHPNKTVLTMKCHGENSPIKSYVQGANILKLEPGCRIHSTDFVFKRNRLIVEEEIPAVLINSPNIEIWEMLTEKSKNQEIKPFLKEMFETEERGISISDIQSKFHLHALRRKTSLTRNVFITSSGFIAIVVIIILLYVCKKNLNCQKFRPIVVTQPLANIQGDQISSTITLSSILPEDETLKSAEKPKQTIPRIYRSDN